jgi:hypothetical protein
MLENKGIKSVTVPVVDSDQLSRLERLVSPRAVVGFPRDLDDIRRKLVPFGPPPPRPTPPPAVIGRFGGQDIPGAFPPTPTPPRGGGGAAALRPSLALSKAGTFTIPGADGKPVTLPLPPSFETPLNAWDSFQPWTPRANVGGIRTEDLEWVFVDKGTWPVMTFFTLAYEPSAPKEGSTP